MLSSVALSNIILARHWALLRLSVIFPGNLTPDLSKSLHHECPPDRMGVGFGHLLLSLPLQSKMLTTDPMLFIDCVAVFDEENYYCLVRNWKKRFSCRQSKNWPGRTSTGTLPSWQKICHWLFQIGAIELALERHFGANPENQNAFRIIMNIFTPLIPCPSWYYCVKDQPA